MGEFGWARVKEVACRLQLRKAAETRGRIQAARLSAALLLEGGGGGGTSVLFNCSGLTSSRAFMKE